MESDSTNLRSIIEDEEEDIEPSTVRSDRMPWKQDLISIQEMEDKENVPEYPEQISDISVSDKKAFQSIQRTKKKGFNLRKSLAWNPAFFTEEGVLEPSELSCICGSIEESNRSTKSSNRHVLNEAVKNSYSRSQMKSELRSHNGRKLFVTPEPPRRQEKKTPEGTRKLKQREPFTKTLLRPPTTSQQKRVANASTTGNVPKVQKFIQGSTTPASRVSNNQENVARAGGSSNRPRRILSVHEKEPVFPPKSSTGAENSAASQMNNQTIPKAPINTPLTIKPSALRKPSPSFGFFAQGNAAAQSSCSSQKSTGKNLTVMPSSLPKPPPSKWRPPVRHDSAIKLKEGTFPQSKIPQRMRFDRPMVNTTGKKCTEESTKASVEPREKSVVSQLECNDFPPGTCSTKDLDTAICRSKGTNLTEKLTTVSVEVKEPAVTQMTYNLVSSKACNLMDVHAMIKPGSAVPADDSSKKNQNPCRAFVEAEESHAAPPTRNSILMEACSSTEENAVVIKSDDVGSNVNTIGVQHMEEENRICGGEETVATLLTPNSILSETCSLMDVDVVISKPDDVNSKADTNGMKHTQYSEMVCEGQKEEAVVIPSTCNHISPETCSSKDKHTTRHNPNVNGPAQGDIPKISISPLRTQRGKIDFSPCKEKPLEKRFKLDSGSSLTIGEKESFEDEKPQAGEVEDKGAKESSEGRIIPKFQTDLVPFSDEWLAALEAYGEEILVKKTGPVQNSPPDKTAPEPSPWSPVRRKAQDIGPYDCTKYSKTTSSDAQ